MNYSPNDRRRLRDAIIAYMNGTISTYAFDDINSECMDSADPSLRTIASRLYLIHDDTVDHSISVTVDTWFSLRRIVAFLNTSLVADSDSNSQFWPFVDETAWVDNRASIDGADLPEYDVEIHACQIHGILNRIPTFVGVGIILVATGLMIVGILAMQ